MSPPEPPVAGRNLPERSGAGKDARQRGEANPCRRAPFWHPHYGRRAAERLEYAKRRKRKRAARVEEDEMIGVGTITRTITVRQAQLCGKLI
jgi:hypothetical protein